MREDHVRSSKVFPTVVTLDHEAAVVSDELQTERTDRGAGVAEAGGRARHIEQAVREIEVTGFNQLDERLTVSKLVGVRVAEDGVAFALHEAQRRREALADERGQLTNDLV